MKTSISSHAAFEGQATRSQSAIAAVGKGLSFLDVVRLCWSASKIRCRTK